MRGLTAAYWLLEDQSLDEGGRHHPAARRGRRRRADRRRSGPSCSACASSAPFRPRKRPSWRGPMAATRSSSTAARTSPTRVRELTGGEGVTTVFDTVGKDTFEGSLKSLKRRGMLVGCGTASGTVPADRRASARDPGFGLFPAAGAGRLHRRSGRARRACGRAVRPCRHRPHQDRDQPALRA